MDRPTLPCVAASLALLSCAHVGRAPEPVPCERLGGTEIAAGEIGLPTTGATVKSASVVGPSGTAPMTVGEYCKLLVAIHAVDRSAPEIVAQVNLPAAWNGKAVMFGGGGYDGIFANAGAGGSGNYFNGPIDRPVPLGQGYATFASDSGHQAGPLTSQDASFALNDEAIRNYLGDALKKTRDAALFLIERRYAKRPSRTFFVGGSTGGREALVAIGRWPQDFDGAVSEYPAWNAATLDLQLGRIARALAQPGAYPNDAKKKVWMDGVLAACDDKDGVKDGIVSNLAGCRFDPAAVRCPGGADSGDACLSDAQIAALTVYGTPIDIPYQTGSGERSYPGFNVFAGTDLTGPLNLKKAQPSHALMTQGPANPDYANMPYGSVFWDQWIKYFVTRDPSFDSLTIDPQAPGAWQQRIADVVGRMDVTRTDFSTFRKRGGKLLLMHGLSDGLVATNATVEFYRRMNATMGTDAVRSFARFYTIPGLGHVFGSPTGAGFAAAWDALGAVERWVETGTPPGQLVAADGAAPTRGRTRPVCEYPAWPRYVGVGDVNAAASFTCVSQ